MSSSFIGCLVAGVLAAILIVFAAAGAAAPDFAASRIGQGSLAALAALVGLACGRAAHRRFFASA